MKYNKAFHAGSSNMCTVITTAPSASSLNGAGNSKEIILMVQEVGDEMDLNR